MFQPKHEMRILVWTGGTYWDPLYEVGRPLPEWSNSFGRDPLSEFVADLQPGESLSSMEYAAGFPCWALRYCETIKHANGNSILLAQDGRVLRVPAWMYEMRLGADLPCWPIWPGFAINTVFYAALLWLAWIAPFALRRRVRIKRGLCVKCGYDLRGATSAVACPECGAAFPAKPQRGAPTTAQGNALGSDYATSPEP